MLAVKILSNLFSSNRYKYNAMFLAELITVLTLTLLELDQDPVMV